MAITKNKENHVVLTTIYVPHVLFDLYKNAKKFKHLNNTVCWVVGDLKSPDECKQICNHINKLGLETYYLDIPTQNTWGQKFPQFYNSIPYNNESRRNIGYLFALQNECKRLISIDDDNFPTEDDFIGAHEIVGSIWKGQVIHEESGFHNVCEYLEIIPNRHIYPRGFPFRLRESHLNDAKLMNNKHEKKILGMNQGLWLKEPDIDATTWLNGKVSSVGYKGKHTVVLDQKTWLPINTQNTCVIRELIPAFFCVPMGYKVPGGKIERYGDIWGGYFSQAIIQNSNYLISFGKPTVEHRRNPHNYLNDLRHEFWGIMLTDWFLEKLKDNFSSQSEKILDRLFELSTFIDESIADLPSWSPNEMKEFMKTTALNLRLWAEVCQELIRE
jgi:hypothetical protein